MARNGFRTTKEASIESGTETTEYVVNWAMTVEPKSLDMSGSCMDSPITDHQNQNYYFQTRRNMVATSAHRVLRLGLSDTGFIFDVKGSCGFPSE